MRRLQYRGERRETTFFVFQISVVAAPDGPSDQPLPSHLHDGHREVGPLAELVQADGPRLSDELLVSDFLHQSEARLPGPAVSAGQRAGRHPVALQAEAKQAGSEGRQEVEEVGGGQRGGGGGALQSQQAYFSPAEPELVQRPGVEAVAGDQQLGPGLDDPGHQGGLQEVSAVVLAAGEQDVGSEALLGSCRPLIVF